MDHQDPPLDPPLPSTATAHLEIDNHHLDCKDKIAKHHHFGIQVFPSLVMKCGARRQHT